MGLDAFCEAAWGSCAECKKELPLRPGGLRGEPLCWVCTHGHDGAVKLVARAFELGHMYFFVGRYELRMIDLSIGSIPHDRALAVSRQIGADLVDVRHASAVHVIAAALCRQVTGAT
jgi:hypothetical protein